MDFFSYHCKMARPRTTDPTENEDKVLAFIDRMVADRGRTPTMGEISKEMNWRAPSTAHGVVKRLKARGLVKGERNRAIERIPGGSA